MIEKEFVPYQESLELKELGFDEPCLKVGNPNGCIMWKWIEVDGDPPTVNINDVIEVSYDDKWIQIPTFSQAFRWFREKYDIHYSIDRECSQHDFKWGYNWSLYNYTGIFDEFLTSHPDAPAGEWVYNTYEEAELACLKKLIEIIKNNKK